MFSDRLWLLKAAAAVGLLSLVCTLSHQDITVRFPPVERVALSWEALRDHTFHLTGQRVFAADAQGFQIGTQVGPLRLLTDTPPPVGSYVTFNARPVAPRTLQILAMDVHSGYTWKRPLNYIISILTVLGYFWLVRRRFSWAPEQGFIRGKY
jgi:hypothetical protein